MLLGRSPAEARFPLPSFLKWMFEMDEKVAHVNCIYASMSVHGIAMR